MLVIDSKARDPAYTGSTRGIYVNDPRHRITAELRGGSDHSLSSGVAFGMRIRDLPTVHMATACQALAVCSAGFSIGSRVTNYDRRRGRDG
jgi:hypothetical protein